MTCIRCHQKPPKSTPWLCEECFNTITREKFVYDSDGPPDWTRLTAYRRRITIRSYEATRRIDQGFVAQPALAALLPDA